MDKCLMKLILFFVALTPLSAAWPEVKLVLYVEDAKGNIDSVIFGSNDDASFGVDTLFGEINLYNTPYDSLEIRSVHRFENRASCLISEDTYGNYESELDLKTDIRHSVLWGIKAYYEFHINAKYYPINIMGDFSELQNIGTMKIASGLNLIKDSCIIVDNRNMVQDSLDNILFTINNDSTCDAILAFITEYTGIGDNRGTKNDQASYGSDAYFQTNVYTLSGQVICRNISRKQLQPIMSDLPRGIYIVTANNSAQILLGGEKHISAGLTDH